MKRAYITPMMAVVDVELNTMIAASVPITDQEKPMGTNKFQGGWSQDQWNTENYF